MIISTQITCLVVDGSELLVGLSILQVILHHRLVDIILKGNTKWLGCGE